MVMLIRVYRLDGYRLLFPSLREMSVLEMKCRGRQAGTLVVRGRARPLGSLAVQLGSGVLLGAVP